MANHLVKKLSSNQHLIIGEFSRYIIVGGLAFGCDFLAYIGLIELVGLNYLLANVFGFCLGLSVNYLLSIYWVFRHRSESSIKREYLLFAGIGLFNLGLGELFLWVLVGLGGLHHILGKIAITSLVFLSNFCMRKMMLFHAKPS